MRGDAAPRVCGPALLRLPAAAAPPRWRRGRVKLVAGALQVADQAGWAVCPAFGVGSVWTRGPLTVDWRRGSGAPPTPTPGVELARVRVLMCCVNPAKGELTTVPDDSWDDWVTRMAERGELTMKTGS